MKHSAVVFPGQGSQFLGMLSDIEPQYHAVTDTMKEASDVVGYDLWALIQQGPLEQLNQTQYTQVAMLASDVALFRILQQYGIDPVVMAGHSLGEYAALVCAQAVSFASAVALVARRGALMQATMPVGLGAMAAVVGLTDDEVRALCAKASSALSQVNPANYNAIGQVVVAGHTAAVEKLIELAYESGAKLAKIIPVSVPCHCPLLLDAAEQFGEALEQTVWHTPKLPVVSNVDLSVYTSSEQIKAKLKEQLYSPVRWVETIQLFRERGVHCVLECGPGKVLSGLIKRIERQLETLNVGDGVSLQQVVQQLQGDVDVSR